MSKHVIGGRLHSGVPATESPEFLEKRATEDAKAYPAPVDYQAVLCLAPITLLHPNRPEGTVQEIAFMDSGCDRVFVLNEVATKLGLKVIKQVSLNVTVFPGRRVRLEFDQVLLRMLFIDGSTPLCVAYGTVEMARDQRLMQHSSGVSTAKPSIMIGVTMFWKILTSKSSDLVKPLENGNMVIRSQIGNIVTGYAGQDQKTCWVNSVTSDLALLHLLEAIDISGIRGRERVL